MAEQKQDDQHEHTFSNYVRIRDVAQKTCQRWWTIGESGERGSGISVLPAWHDDEEDDKYLSILEAVNIKQKETKEKLRKNISEEPESYSRQNYIAETLSNG